MKKMMMITLAFIGLLLINNSNLFAVAKTKVVTAYYCDFGPGHCLKFQGNGDIWLTIPGVLKTITIRVPAVAESVPDVPEGYYSVNKFFLFSEPANQNVGIGLINGVLHYSDVNPEFYYYELEDQEVITDYNLWEESAR